MLVIMKQFIQVCFPFAVPDPVISFADIQGAMVGNPQEIHCTVSTVSGVEPHSVMISWVRPGGDTIANDSRVTISPTSGSGNNYTSSLQFMYLMEGDEGTYECNLMILETTASNTAILTPAGMYGSCGKTYTHNILQLVNNLIEFYDFMCLSMICCVFSLVPLPSVVLTAPNTQIVGQSLTLECSVTTVRGITSRVDIVWSTGSTELVRRMGVTSSLMTDNSIIFTDVYTIPQLSTTHEGQSYECEVAVDSSSPVSASNSATLNVTGKCNINVPRNLYVNKTT